MYGVLSADGTVASADEYMYGLLFPAHRTVANADVLMVH
jgi:hypothetical protein